MPVVGPTPAGVVNATPRTVGVTPTTVGVTPSTVGNTPSLTLVVGKTCGTGDPFVKEKR